MSVPNGTSLDQLAIIAQAKIPLRHTISLDDGIVSAEENTLEAARRLKALGWDMEIVSIPQGSKLEGHHFPIPEAEKSAGFIERHASLEK